MYVAKVAHEFLCVTIFSPHVRAPISAPVTKAKVNKFAPARRHCARAISRHKRIPLLLQTAIPSHKRVIVHDEPVERTVHEHLRCIERLLILWVFRKLLKCSVCCYLFERIKVRRFSIGYRKEPEYCLHYFFGKIHLETTASCNCFSLSLSLRVWIYFYSILYTSVKDFERNTNWRL